MVLELSAWGRPLALSKTVNSPSASLPFSPRRRCPFVRNLCFFDPKTGFHRGPCLLRAFRKPGCETLGSGIENLAKKKLLLAGNKRIERVLPPGGNLKKKVPLVFRKNPKP